MTPRARRAAAAVTALVTLWLPSAAAADPRVIAAAGVPADPVRDAAWQRFFAALPHGPELDALTVIVAPPAEVTRGCGRGADGCYRALLRQIVMPGAAGPSDPYAADIARHEYGHHLAASSDNTPFDSSLGTKRWFTYERICARLRAGLLSDDVSMPYELSPAEGFAEAYRLTAGGSRHAWIVDPALFPDRGARRAILADARRPWAGGRERRFAGRLSQRHPVRTLRLHVPLDGTVRAVAEGSGPLRLRMTLSDHGKVIARGTRVRYVDCGRRLLRLGVHALRGSGRFSVSVTVP